MANVLTLICCGLETVVGFSLIGGCCGRSQDDVYDDGEAKCSGDDCARADSVNCRIFERSEGKRLSEASSIVTLYDSARASDRNRYCIDLVSRRAVC